MEWLSANWLWVLIGIAFIAMHMFGHGGHGGHRGHGGSNRGREIRPDSAEGREEYAPPAHPTRGPRSGSCRPPRSSGTVQRRQDHGPVVALARKQARREPLSSPR
jgi:hypothetical protein